MVTTGLSAGTFLFATPQPLFDFPDLAWGERELSLRSADASGAYQISWSPNAPAHFVNSGRFTLTAEWWNGHPMAGGKLSPMHPI